MDIKWVRSKTLQAAIGNLKFRVPSLIAKGHLKKMVPGPKEILSRQE